MTTQFIINHLWQTSCFVPLAGLLAFALRKNSPKVRYWVWLSASLKFLVPFALLVSLGSVVPRPDRQALSAPVPVFSSTLIQIAEPFSPAFASTVPARAPIHWASIMLGLIWALGFAAITRMRCCSWFRIHAILRASTRIDLPIPVPAFVTPGMEEPGVVGFLRPALVLPAQLLEHLNPRQLHALLTHELCHIRRRDNLFAAFHMVVEAIFWFHPLVWWIGSRMVEERELACDEEVLRVGCEPTEYVEGILKVCRFFTESSLPCVSGVTGADVKKRLHDILGGSVARELNVTRKVVLVALGLGVLAVPIFIGVLDAPAIRAQTASAAAGRFEVASIRPAQQPTADRPVWWGIRSDPAQVTYSHQTGLGLIASAYELDAERISGGPGWIRADAYDIVAKLPPDTPKVRIPSLLKALLAERFGLVVHQETKDVAVYAMVPGKGGPKLKSSSDSSDTDSSGAPKELSSVPLKMIAGGAKLGICCGRAELHRVTMAAFAELLAAQTDRPVIDRTGISGTFEISLHWADDSPEQPDAASERSIYTAVQEQLGIKLEPVRGPSKFLVIDHVERPSEN